ncbi:phosphatidylinositol transfer protein alpha isoform-like isoform X2 [Petaurus breviceps papuanus]|uniref:phosphatidylinositol transfer protein alpha isoform-like isoform X2 n=1 Tax=Petaurus breviceps papuanus TaxID=3040969 RepID=UPI0036DA8275
MKDDFFIKIETWHHPDMGTQDNVHHLDAETWKEVEVVHIDIADRTQVSDEDYKPEEDPALFRSVKTGRGPLGPNWQTELLKHPPHMCAYKLVTVKFRWWGLQGRVENFIHKQEKRLFTNFHRQLFCWLDQWVDLSMEDIRNLEEETQRELDQVPALRWKIEGNLVQYRPSRQEEKVKLLLWGWGGRDGIPACPSPALSHHTLSCPGAFPIPRNTWGPGVGVTFQGQTLQPLLPFKPGKDMGSRGNLTYCHS